LWLLGEYFDCWGSIAHTGRGKKRIVGATTRLVRGLLCVGELEVGSAGGRRKAPASEGGRYREMVAVACCEANTRRKDFGACCSDYPRVIIVYWLLATRISL